MNIPGMSSRLISGDDCSQYNLDIQYLGHDSILENLSGANCIQKFNFYVYLPKHSLICVNLFSKATSELFEVNLLINFEIPLSRDSCVTALRDSTDTQGETKPIRDIRNETTPVARTELTFGAHWCL